MSKKIHLIHSDEYKNWIFDKNHPTQGRRFTNALNLLRNASEAGEQIPNFRFRNREPSLGLNLLPEIHVIPHFNRFFKQSPESAAKLLLHVPNDEILIGVDDLTAIVKHSGNAHWVVVGEAKVHVFKGLPDQQLPDGQEIKLTMQPDN